MKIKYVRNLMASHMVIEQKKELEEWETEMISHCRSKGILFAKSQREDDRKMLWYDITGRQALEVMLEGRELNHAMLCHFLMQLYEAAETLEAHLLLSGALLLRPECIFTDYGMDQIYFCYYPGNEENLLQAFGNLMEYLLTKLDHKDERAVETAYGIHEKIVTEGAGLLKLGELLRAPYGKESGYQGGEAERTVSKNMGEALIGQEETSQQVISGEGKEKEKVLKRIRRKLRDFFDNSWPGIRRKKESEQNEPFVFEPEDEPDMKAARPTVLLTQISGQPQGILRYEGSNGCSNLEIKDTPYVIGSEEACDGYIPSSTVSRRHARITRVEEIYFIEDLNSSNGTYVGGELLNYKVKMSLEKNEIILFADEKFRFI